MLTFVSSFCVIIEQLLLQLTLSDGLSSKHQELTFCAECKMLCLIRTLLNYYCKTQEHEEFLSF